MTKSPARNHLTPRKAPVQRRSAATVEALVEAAARILEREGLDAYTTNAVAARAGVSIGSLYQYFPGKDALTVALMQRETQRFVEDMDRAMAEPDGMVALGLLIGAAVRQQLQRPMLARLLDEQEASPALRDAVDCDGMDTPVAAILRRLLPAGDARAAHAAVDLGEIIHVMVDSAGARGEHDIASLETRLRAAVFGYLRELGLLPAAAPTGPSA